MDNKQKAGLLVDALYHAALEPTSYSGRGMFGERCVGFDPDCNSETELVGMVREALTDLGHSESVATEVSRLVPDYTEDSLGRGVIWYYPALPWPESHD